MVECLHRTLKAALIAHCTDSSWFHQLPWVLPRLQTMAKEDLDVSAAEMVYGDPLVIPAEFFPATNVPEDLRRLQQIVGKFAPVRTTHRSYRKTYIPKDLSSSAQVFIPEIVIVSHSPHLTPDNTRSSSDDQMHSTSTSAGNKNGPPSIVLNLHF